MADWQDTLAGERMQVDREFGARVRESPLSNQQWNVVMTAVEFEFEHPADPERARIVANTGNVEHVMAEVRTIGQRGPRGTGSSGADEGEGVLDAVKSALGLDGGDSDDDLRAAAEELAAAYADELQAHLEREGKFERVRRRAAEET